MNMLINEDTEKEPKRAIFGAIIRCTNFIIAPFFQNVNISKSIFLKEGEKLMTFSQKIYFLRTQRGLTQTELAKLAEVSQGRIAQYEKGNTKPGATVLVKLAKLFSVKPEILIDDERSL